MTSQDLIVRTGVNSMTPMGIVVRIVELDEVNR
jgi:hypothetical protein